MSTAQFTVYNPTTGQILRLGACPDVDVQSQAGTGEAVLPSLAKQNQYVVNGAFVDLPAKPGNNYDYDYTNKVWVLNTDQAALQIRNTRTSLLTQCDWTQATDSPLTASVKQQWITYRQALRDITKQSTFPTTVTWPTAPV
jgi:hypothetical protein